MSSVLYRTHSFQFERFSRYTNRQYSLRRNGFSPRKRPPDKKTAGDVLLYGFPLIFSVPPPRVALQKSKKFFLPRARKTPPVVRAGGAEGIVPLRTEHTLFREESSYGQRENCGILPELRKTAERKKCLPLPAMRRAAVRRLRAKRKRGVPPLFHPDGPAELKKGALTISAPLFFRRKGGFSKKFRPRRIEASRDRDRKTTSLSIRRRRASP